MDLFDVTGSEYFAEVFFPVYNKHNLSVPSCSLYPSYILSLSNINITLLQTGAEWLSELESNVDDRNDVLQTTTGQTGNREDSKENFFKHLTKLTVLPPLKNNPATRLAFKPVTSIFQIKFDLF